MATLSKGKTFTNGETVTPQKLHELVDLGAVSGIVNADISATAAIADNKLAQISTAGKVLPAAVQGTAVVTADPRLSDARVPVPHGHAISDTTGLQTALDGKQASGSYASASHTHDDRYYTETEMNTLLAGKQASGSYAPATGIEPSAITGTAVITTDSRLSDARIPSDGSVTDAKISSTATIADTKLATISAAGKVSNSATTATNANTANAIVARDTSGNFSAGTITAALSGNAATATTAASCSGNAATATTLQTARTINGVSFNGSADITVTANPNTHTHDDRYYTETEITTLLSDKQKINGQTISAGLNWNGNTGIQFSNIPSGVQKFTLLVEIWIHSYTSQPGRGVVNIGTTTSGLITWNSSGDPIDILTPYNAAVNNIENYAGFEITGGANTSAEHVGVFNFYVTNTPFFPAKKRLICESHVAQKNTSTGAITILQGTGFIDYTGEINQFVLRPVYNSNLASGAAARLYYYY